MAKVFSLTLENFSETVAQIDAELLKTKATKKESANAQLLLEETFMRLVNIGKAEIVNVKISQRFGDLNLQLESEGVEYNPIVSVTDYDEEDADYFRTIILKANAHKMSYTRKGNKNLVTIQIHEDTNKQLNYTLFGLITGIIVGFVLKFTASPEIISFFNDSISGTVQTMFMNALNMMIAPVVFFSIITGITGVTNAADVGRIGGKILLLYCITTIIAIILGLTVAQIAFSSGLPQVGIVEGKIAEQVEFSFITMIVNIIPKNLIDPIINREMLQIIFLAVLFGICINKLGDKLKLLSDLVKLINMLVLTVLSLIMKFIPLITFFAMATLILTLGMDSIILLGKLLLILVCTYSSMSIVYFLLIRTFGKISPMPFLKKLPHFLLMPFSLSSSSATIPFTMKFCTEKLGIAPKVSSFSIPIGSTINMDGASIFHSVILTILLKMYGVEINADVLCILAISVFTISVGAPGIPCGGIVMATAVLGIFGVPAEAITIIMGIFPIEDRITTTSNVVGDIAVTTAIAANENLLDMNIYEQRN